MSNPGEDDARRAVHVGMGMASPLWTGFWLAAGAGAAYWWWTAMVRPGAQAGVISALPAPLGPSPGPARPSPVGRRGEAPVEVAPPELVMAHNPPPPEAPDHPAHPSDARIPEPPPEMLAHTPPETVGVSFKSGTGFENPTHDPASVFEPVSDGDDSGETQSAKRKPARAKTKASLDLASDEAAEGVLLASPAGQPVFDPGALATETSVAALTAGEAMDDTAAPMQAIGEPDAVAPTPKPRSRKKPGTAPEA